MIDRRAFLRALGFGTVAAAAAATSVLDLERLLWIPGERVIVLPSVGNTLITPTWMSKELMRTFVNDLKFASFVSREYDQIPVIGSRVTVSLPRRFV